jgi:ubiquinone/menaquinone biosynthesis C-methylase UbiE
MKKVMKGSEKRRTTYFVPGTAENLPFKRNSFETVSAVTSVHHFSDQDKALDEIHRVLSSSGKVFIYEFDGSGWIARALQFFENKLLRANVRFRRQTELQEMLKRHSLVTSLPSNRHLGSS